MSDVDVDRAALQGAALTVSTATMSYHGSAVSAWVAETGVGNPCGRTSLRVMLENAIGAIRMDARTHAVSALEVQQRLVDIVQAFDDLDVALGAGWDRAGWDRSP